VCLVAEARAAPVSGRAAVLDPGDPLVIETDGALDPLAPRDDACMGDDQEQKRAGRRDQPGTVL
jgi:hypothetical protein